MNHAHTFSNIAVLILMAASFIIGCALGKAKKKDRHTTQWD
jgi:hypothetical protein